MIIWHSNDHQLINLWLSLGWCWNYSSLQLYEMQCPYKSVINLLECRTLRTQRKRSSIPDLEAWSAAAGWDWEQSRYLLPWPPVPEEMLASGHSGRRAIGERLARPFSLIAAISLFSSTHSPSVHPELRQGTESCSPSNGQACSCPWGSFLDRIPLCPLPVKGRPLCWMVVYLRRHVRFSVPWLPSLLSLRFSSSSPLILNAKTHL